MSTGSDMPYVLTRKETSPGRFTVRRYLWMEFPKAGEWVRMNGHVIASNLSDEGSKALAARYVAEHPGHTRTAPETADV